jgi:hypothetical protein
MAEERVLLIACGGSWADVTQRYLEQERLIVITHRMRNTVTIEELERADLILYGGSLTVATIDIDHQYRDKTGIVRFGGAPDSYTAEVRQEGFHGVLIRIYTQPKGFVKEVQRCLRELQSQKGEGQE